MDLTLLGLAGPVSSQASGSKGAAAPVGGDFAQRLAALGGQAAPLDNSGRPANGQASDRCAVAKRGRPWLAKGKTETRARLGLAGRAILQSADGSTLCPAPPPTSVPARIRTWVPPPTLAIC